MLLILSQAENRAIKYYLDTKGNINSFALLFIAIFGTSYFVNS